MSKPFKLGVLVDNFRMGVRAGILKAAELGVDGVQIYCIAGELAPEAMTAQQRREFKAFVAGQGLEISALCGDLGKGFLNAEHNRAVLPRMKEIVNLAAEIETRIVTSHIGRLPDDDRDRTWRVGLDAFNELGAYAEKHGCILAMETGPEEPAVLRRFLDRIENKGIGVNYDPANLVMAGPYDHIGGVRVLQPYIVHTHAKDGVRLFSEKSAGNDLSKRRIMETPLGQGGVAFRYYLWALREIGYHGYLTVEREGGSDAARDIGDAVKYLRELDPWNGMIWRHKENQYAPVAIPAV